MAISKRQDSRQGWQEKYSNSEEPIRLELCDIRSANSCIWSIFKEKSKSEEYHELECSQYQRCSPIVRDITVSEQFLSRRDGST